VLRAALVDADFGPVAFLAVREKYRVKSVGTDDVFDAFAALWTAAHIFPGQARTLPTAVSRDRLGLRMEIVY
jgi:predicted RNase H-like nuclease